MSASTATAAVPEPNDTPGTTPPNTPAPGLLTSLLTPVAPARSAAFNLAHQATDGTPATGAALSSESVSSDAFHGDGDNQQDTKDTSNGNGAGKQPQSVWRAWMLAGAARWARGGGTQNKRLDMKKARAQAHQVKESRTVNSGAGLGAGGGRGSTASGAGGGKSLNSKAPKNGPGGSSKGPKNSTGPANSGAGAGRGPAGRDTNRSTDRSSAGPKPGSGNSPKHGMAPTVKPGTGTPGKSPKLSKDTSSSTPKPTKANTGPGAKPGPSGNAGAPGTPGKSGGASGNSSNTAKGDKPAKGTGTPKDPKSQAGKDSDTNPKTPASGTATAVKDTTSAEEKKQPKLSLLKRKKTAPAVPPTATGDKQPAATSDKDEKAKKTDPPTTDKQPPATPKNTDSPAKPTTPPADKGKPFTTRPSRETGYRDGTRAAQAAAHIKAYRDGARDGWTDTAEAAAREKARLDQAHADRKTARQETPVTLATSTDHHQAAADGATPIPVDHVSSTHVFLGEGAHRASMTRGEIRSLKGFERRLEERATRLDTRAEQTRGLKAHAEAQAKDAGRLLEVARSAQAGDKYIGTLTRLQEAAQVQAAKAEEIYVRALRGAEHCRTTLNNAQTRYGGIYQAVLDSPETEPAELDFYKG